MGALIVGLLMLLFVIACFYNPGLLVLVIVVLMGLWLLTLPFKLVRFIMRSKR